MTSPGAITRFVGVYDADGGFAGEARYVVGHLLGRVDCALCDITHGAIRRKRAFDELRARLRVPFALVHRNERDERVTAGTGDALPCVAAEIDGEMVELLGPEDLAACRADVSRFELALRAACARRGLDFPA